MAHVTRLIHILLTLSFLLIGSKAHTCGTSYALPSGSTEPNSVAFSSNGEYLATADYGSNNVTIFNVTSGVLSGGTSYALPSGSSYPLSVTFSPDGSHLATANRGSATESDMGAGITLFNVSGGVLSDGTSYALPSGSSQPFSLVFSPDGSLLATANYGSSNVTLFTVTGGVLSGDTSYGLPTTTSSGEPASIAFSPDGNYLAVAAGDVAVFTVSSGALSGGTSYPLPSGSIYPQSIAFSPNGSYLATANIGTGRSSNPGAGVTVFSVSSGELSGGISYALPSGSTHASSVAFSPNGAYLATANPGSCCGGIDNITLFNVSEGVLSGGFAYSLPSGSSGPESLIFSPDGSYLATANFDSNNVTIFNTTCLTVSTTMANTSTTTSTTGAMTSAPGTTTGLTTGTNETSSSSSFVCDAGCIAGFTIAGVAVLTATALSAFLVKKYCFGGTEGDAYVAFNNPATQAEAFRASSTIPEPVEPLRGRSYLPWKTLHT